MLADLYADISQNVIQMHSDALSGSLSAEG